MNTKTRQPDLSELDKLMAFNTSLPTLALSAACRGEIDLARAYLRVAQQRGVDCVSVAAQIEQTAKGLTS